MLEKSNFRYTWELFVHGSENLERRCANFCPLNGAKFLQVKSESMKEGRERVLSLAPAGCRKPRMGKCIQPPQAV